MIKIGVVGPFSGPRAYYGKLLVSAVLKSNYAKYFDFIYKDDQSNANLATEIAIELSRMQVAAVIGHFNSQSAEAALKVYPPDLPVVLPASTAYNLKYYSNVYRICANDLQQAELIIYTIDHLKYNNCYLIADDSEYSAAIKKFLPNYLNLDINDNHSVNAGDLLICLGAHYKIANALQNLKFSGEITAICCDDCSIEEFEKITHNLDRIKKLIIQPNPDFMQCVMLGIEKLYQIFYEGKFAPGENPAAKFIIKQLE